MKALTVTQPWATLVIRGVKRFETRSWAPPDAVIGTRIAIHAAKGWRAADREMADFWHNDGTLAEPRADLPLGMILGTIEIAGARRTFPLPDEITAREMMMGDYSRGRWAWILADPRPLAEPIPWRGALGLWTLPDEVLP